MVLTLRQRKPDIVSVAPKSVWMASTQPAITCSKLTIETLEEGVKYVQS